MGTATIPADTRPVWRVNTVAAMAPLAAPPRPTPRSTLSPQAVIAETQPVTLFASFNRLYRSNSA